MTWTPERRARQAELIRATRPWEHATGPTSDAGKATSARNAYKGGRRARQRRAMAALRLIEALWRADRTCVTAVQRMVSERWIIAALLTWKSAGTVCVFGSKSLTWLSPKSQMTRPSERGTEKAPSPAVQPSVR